MSTLTKPEVVPEPVGAEVTSDALRVELADGRSISVPLLWFPRLRHGNKQERANFELGRNGIHWPDLDEDIPVAGLLNGEKSGEALASIQRWLKGRKPRRVQESNGAKEPLEVDAGIARLPLYRGKHPTSQKT